MQLPRARVPVRRRERRARARGQSCTRRRPCAPPPAAGARSAPRAGGGGQWGEGEAGHAPARERGGAAAGARGPGRPLVPLLRL